MADLNSFLGKDNFQLEELLPENDSVEVNSPPSNKNLAAYTAVITDQPELAEDTYRQTVSQLEQGGTGSEENPTLSLAKAKSIEASRESLIELLSDPNISDEAKQEASSTYLDEKSEMYNIRNVVSSEALIQDSGYEPEEQEKVRVSLASAIDGINSYKRQQQAVLNQQVAATNSDITSSFFDIVEYFSPYVESKFVGDVLSEYRGGDSSAFLKSFTLLGNAKEELVTALDKMSPSERMEVTSKLVSIINSHSSIVMPDENDYARVDLLRTILEDGYYDDTSVWIDNIVSVLDMTAFGGVLGRLSSKFAKVSGLKESAKRMMVRRSVRSRTQPTTVSQNYKDVNPDKAKSTHDAVLQDETGEVADATYGTSREDAIANDILPEVDGESVPSKVGRPESVSDERITPDADIMDAVNRDGQVYYTEMEKKRARSKTFNDFFNATNIMPRKEMFRISESEEGGTTIKAVYGPEQQGYSDPSEAIEQVKYSLRHQGISDENITLLRREGSEYVPTSLKDLKGMEAIGRVRVKREDGVEEVIEAPSKDFLVQVDYSYNTNPLDVTGFDNLSVSDLNFFDKSKVFSGNSQGSFTRHLFDAHSLLDSHITLGANVAVDKASQLEKQLLELGVQFSDVYTKLPKDRQNMMESLIKEANFKGQDFNYNRMVGDGFSTDEIKALKAWRNAWDTMYWLENKDLVKSLVAKNYQVLENGPTRLFARPVSRNQSGVGKKVYDPLEDKVRVISNEELDTLYKEGGTVAQLRRPMLLEDDGVEFIISTNKPGSTYLRKLNANDQVLNYRKGYYTVQYTAPKYVVKKVKDKTGEVVYEKAVAMAGNTADAVHISKRMSKMDGAEYFVRGDVKKARMDSDEYWDMQQSSGRTAQRIRGDRLEEGTDPMNSGADNQFVMSPVDSLINSARSTANRVSMRDYLEGTKARFLEQYSEVLPHKNGKAIFPNRSSEIGLAGRESDKLAADARTTWEYINYMEDGYINGIDEIYRSILSSMANDVKGISKKGEEILLKLSNTRGPSSSGKGLAFVMYLALNSLRQIVVQGHQAMQLTALFPKYVLSQRLAADMVVMMVKKLGSEKVPSLLLKVAGRTQKEVDEMFKQYTRSGLSASISKHNLLRGSMSEMTDMTKYTGKKGVASKSVSFFRKIGFDFGEEVTMMSSWLAHRNQALEKVKKLSESDLDTVSGKARNFTYNMNAAGDMPYNQNFLSLVFQFMQVPHKALLQMTTNRVLTRSEKGRLAVFSAAMYTLPVASMYDLFGDILPEDPEAKDLVVMGLEGYMFNKILQLTTGEEARVDFSGLSPLDMYGTYEFIHSIFTTDFPTILSSSPSGQLLFGNNPRITNLAKTASRYMGVVKDFENPTELSDVGKAFGELSSGYSNGFKAIYALKHAQVINSYGGITDPEVSTPESIAQFMGFPTMDTSQSYYINNKLYRESKAFREDLKKWYRDVKRHAARQGLTTEDTEYQLTVLGEAWRVFGENEDKAREMIKSELERDIRKGDATLFKAVLRTANWLDNDEIKKMVEAVPNISEEKRDELKKSFEFIDSYKDER